MRPLPVLLLPLLVVVAIGCGGESSEAPSVPAADDRPARSAAATRLDEVAAGMSDDDDTDSALEVGDLDEGLPAVEWNHKLTALRRLRVGMTIEQVEEILGFADETNEDDNDPTGVLAERGETLTIATWRGDDPGDAGDFIKIGFVNGRIKNLELIEVHAANE